MTRFSISSRLIVSSVAVLLGFLGLTGLILSQAFERSARAAVLERLQSHIYMLLSAAETDGGDRLLLPERLPEPRLSTFESGLYAQVFEGDRVVWRSESLSGLQLSRLPADTPGVAVTRREAGTGSGMLSMLSFAVDWEAREDGVRRYVFQVAESESGLEAEIGVFQRSLWLWLGALAVVLVVAQASILRWSIAPLRRVARELREVETGERERLSSEYPRELRSLTRNLNHFIGQSHGRVKRYRNALGNLAHSLKTPLAVIRSELESEEAESLKDNIVLQQLGRMDQTVEYQLRRANAVGRSPLTAPVPVAPVMRRLGAVLGKMHGARTLHLDVRDTDCSFPGDEGDLTEILGNLADNACKWANSRVRLWAFRVPQGDELVLVVEDDGPGISAEDVPRVLRRGQRLDPETDGHGLGLAVVRELVEDVYGGRLTISSAEMGGARLEVGIPVAL